MTIDVKDTISQETKNDILAYLIVLNYIPVIKKISFADQKVGISNIVGCLHRVENFLNFKNFQLASMLKYRESLNGHYSTHRRHGPPSLTDRLVSYDDQESAILDRVTKELSEALYDFLYNVDEEEESVGVSYCNNGVSNEIKEKFLNSLNIEFLKILE